VKLSDTVTTGENCVAESKPLYLGKYEIYETEAPFGMVINTEVHSAELVYAGRKLRSPKRLQASAMTV
jgi:hypothetical protein